MIDEQNQEEQVEQEELDQEEELLDDTNEEGNDDDTIDWKALALKNRGIAKRLQTKLGKAKEAKPSEEAKLEAKDVKNVSEDKLSTTDFYALTRANVPEEDVKEVIAFANFKGISVSEALKDSVVKTILKEKEESRNVAQATNTGNSRTGNVKTSAETLLSKASKGELPDSDEDLDTLLEARIEEQRKRNK